MVIPTNLFTGIKTLKCLEVISVSHFAYFFPPGNMTIFIAQVRITRVIPVEPFVEVVVLKSNTSAPGPGGHKLTHKSLGGERKSR